MEANILLKLVKPEYIEGAPLGVSLPMRDLTEADLREREVTLEEALATKLWVLAPGIESKMEMPEDAPKFSEGE